MITKELLLCSNEEFVTVNREQLIAILDELNKLKVEVQTSSSKTQKLDISFIPVVFRDIVMDWIDYKKERGQGYKAKGFACFYKRLLKLSKSNPHKARQIIEQSMANNWAGIFPLKEDNLSLGMILTGDRSKKYEDAEEW